MAGRTRLMLGILALVLILIALLALAFALAPTPVEYLSAPVTPTFMAQPVRTP